MDAETLNLGTSCDYSSDGAFLKIMSTISRTPGKHTENSVDPKTALFRNYL
jgi:hypothetical protein